MLENKAQTWVAQIWIIGRLAICVSSNRIHFARSGPPSAFNIVSEMPPGWGEYNSEGVYMLVNQTQDFSLEITKSNRKGIQFYITVNRHPSTTAG